MGRVKIKSKVETVEHVDMEAIAAIDAEMGYTDSTVIILYKKQPYLDWTLSLADPMPKSTLAQLNKEPTTYLIPYSDDYAHPQKWVKRNWEKLFLEELHGWTTDPKEWPQNRTYKMFQEWFKVEWSTDTREVGKDFELSFDPEDP
jgi:hypothetical protein